MDCTVYQPQNQSLANSSKVGVQVKFGYISVAKLNTNHILIIVTECTIIM